MRIRAGALLAFAAVGSSWVASGASRHVTHEIKIENVKFAPDSLTVHVGDTVVWKNLDIVPHTATAQQKGLFNSGPILPNKSFSYKAVKVMDIPYSCLYHPQMHASITVVK